MNAINTDSTVSKLVTTGVIGAFYQKAALFNENDIKKIFDGSKSNIIIFL